MAGRTLDEQDRGRAAAVPRDPDEREMPVYDRPEPEAPAVEEPLADDDGDERHDPAPLYT